MEILKDIIKPLYNSCFSVDKTRDPVIIMSELLKDDFQSINAGETKSKAQLIGHVHHLEEWTTAIKQLKGKAA
jgi:hypothetical protein